MSVLARPAPMMMRSTTMPVPTQQMVTEARARREQVKTAPIAVDMQAVLDLIGACAETAGALDGLSTVVDDRSKSEQAGELGRQLNRLADMLAAAGAEAKMEYWRLKGHGDPRD